jgi:hypothetical protein
MSANWRKREYEVFAAQLRAPRLFDANVFNAKVFKTMAFFNV